MTYKGFEIFPKEFLALNQIDKRINHERIVLGQPYNKNIYLYNKSPRYAENVTIKFDNYKEFDKIRSFFLNLKGKATLFWFFSFVNEFRLYDKAHRGSNKIFFYNPLFINIIQQRPIFIYIPSLDFVTQVVQIADFGSVGNLKQYKVGEFYIKDPLPADLTLKNCKNICLLNLGFSNRDDIEFKFIDLVRGETNFSFKEITIAHYKKLGLF